jgi:predicted dehydrogenase
MKIGIVGAENSHTQHIARILNVEQKVAGAEVTCVWGETKGAAEDAAMEGQIGSIVERPEDMLGEIDAVVVDHRHPKYHLQAAAPFVDRRIPVFIDKPFCYRSMEGAEFLRRAHESATPVTSFSVLPFQSSFRSFVDEINQRDADPIGGTYGPCDLESPYGGVFFYGIHQVDMVLHAFGYDVVSAHVSRNGDNAIATLHYADGRIATMNLIKEGAPGFGVYTLGPNGLIRSAITWDTDRYEEGVRTFVAMFQTGTLPFTDEQILRPVQVLEALERSLQTGAPESVRL